MALDPEETLARIIPFDISGTISSVIGLTMAAQGFPVPLGAQCRISRQSGPPLDAEVVGFRDDATLLIGYGDPRGVRRGDVVKLVSTTPTIHVGPSMRGRVFDGLARPIDSGPAVSLPFRAEIYGNPPDPMLRQRIDEPMPTGIRAIDSLLTCAKGQRLGIFAGTGVGKSVTLGMIARYAQADVIVLALIGERGREVREFIEKDLGPEGLARSVVVTATSDEPALVRVKAAFTATAVAEYFRDQGLNVLLMMDSLTRLAMAQREIGLSAGEPPTTKGYPPSLFALMPRLLERAGMGPTGSITALYTVLVEADDMNEIVSDTVRGILDGHVWLNRRLAAQAHFPAIDVLESISRSMPDVVADDHLNDAMALKRLISTYRENEDLISVGAYAPGSNPDIDTAIRMREPINKFLRQLMKEHTSFEESRRMLRLLIQESLKRQPSPGVQQAGRQQAGAQQAGRQQAGAQQAGRQQAGAARVQGQQAARPQGGGPPGGRPAPQPPTGSRLISGPGQPGRPGPLG
ncbi:putative ATP synthase YscN [Planctomycetes bacterium Pan216]|uniref:Putative ATP synthase YscN n=1 Tax=Kolteria novifilia TaxID=2527975 RepID=A0A518BBX1_9BACT|nr:putative ATP synthase YscN [Planctomycetes bacterium Pan216]